MRIVSAIFAGLTACLILSSCTTSKRVTVVLSPKKEEIITKPILTNFLRSNKTPSIIIRVPDQKDVISQLNSYSVNSTYNTMEKEFIKSGFTVRDRAIFEKIANQNQQIDYSKLQALTNVDLLIDLVSITSFTTATNSYQDKTGKTKIMTPEASFTGYSFEFKIVKVKENEVAGSYTFNYTPCTGGGCQYDYYKGYGLYQPASKTQAASVGAYQTMPLDAWVETMKAFTKTMINEMRK